MAMRKIPKRQRRIKGGVGKTPAELIHAYMAFRAGREGVAHTLPVAFYRDAIKKGVKTFFGVEIRDGALIRDTQQPEMFKEWESGRIVHGEGL